MVSSLLNKRMKIVAYLRLPCFFYYKRTKSMVQYEIKTVDFLKYVHSVLAYLGLYVVVVFVGIFLVCFDNVDMQEAIGAVLTCFNNVGPAFGRLSPVGNFSELSCFTKLVLSFLMLAGRLEISPMLIVFYYKAWKRKN